MSVARYRRALAVVFLVVWGNPVGAQFTPTANLTSTSISFSGCSTASQVSSWSWGVSNTTTVSTSGTVHVDELVIDKNFDACSVNLFQASASGSHYSTVTLTESDNSKNVLFRMAMTNVFVSEYAVQGATTTSGPTESVALTMQQVSITDPSGNASCFNVSTAMNC